MISDSSFVQYTSCLNLGVPPPPALVRSYGISLVSTFLHIVVRSHLLYYCCRINGSWFISSFIQY